MRHQFEIHFVRQGRKEILRTAHSTMSEIIALKIVIIESGICVGRTQLLRSRIELIEFARSLNIHSVRWNRASHTMAFAERTKLKSQTIELVDVTGE